MASPAPPRSSPTRTAVIGHVEWVEFAAVDHVPEPGEIVHATETWEEPGGAGAVAAVQLAKLSGECSLFTALGDDALGHRAARELARLGVTVRTTFRPAAQRRCFTYIDREAERTITTIGRRLGPSGRDPLPWEELDGIDAAYFVAGDRGALMAARRARRLVATSRVVADLAGSRVGLDAIVGSGNDRDERYEDGALDPPPGVVVLTNGARGGTYSAADGSSGSFEAVPPPGEVRDTYGCGDSFAAGFAFGLGAGQRLEEALALGARCGAACLTGRGPYEGQLRLTRAAS